jgi:hypothetical protein
VAACVTVKVWPPAVMVPVRLDVVVLVATLYVTDPLPEPDPPVMTTIHDALLVAVQLQPVAEVTVKLAEPPVADGDADVGVSE